MSQKPRWWWLTIRVMGLLDVVDGLCLLIAGRSKGLGFKFTAWDAKRTLQANIQRRERERLAKPDGATDVQGSGDR